MLRTTLKTSAAIAVLCTFASSAFADVDAQKVRANLEKQLAEQGLFIAGGNATLEGSDNVILSGMTLKTLKSEPINLDQVLLKGVVEAPNDGFIVDSVAVSPIALSENGFSFNFGGAVIEGYFIAGPSETNPVLKKGIFRTMKTGPISVGPSGKPIFSTAGYEATVSDYMASDTLDTDVKMTDIVIDFTAFPDQKTRDTMNKLGYDQLKGEMTGKGTWDMSTGNGSANPVKFAFENAADLTVEMAVDGYTLELIDAMQAMQKDMAGNEQAMGMAMLGLMQQLYLRSAVITIDDHSLTGRLIDYFGGLQGMNRESTIAFAKGMLPFGLAQIGNPDFAAKASAALGQYLDNPQNLRLEAAPTAPVPFASIAAGAASNPGSIIDLLNVKISANQ